MKHAQSFSLGGSCHGGGKSRYHNSSSRYNSSRNSPRRYQSHNQSLNTSSHHSGHGKSFRKNSLTSAASFDPLEGESTHSMRSASGGFQHSYKKPVMPPKQSYLAMDCEMVGTVTGESVAARIVLVDWKGRTVMDSYMKTKDEVADYRTFVSGIRAEHLESAPDFETVIQQANELLADKILVGHGLDNDLKALKMTHPWNMTRDTAYYQPFMQLLEGRGQPVWGPRKLKEIAKEKLQRDIQVAGVSHCPVEDATAALDLYKSHRPRWEACMSNEEKRARQQALQEAAAAAMSSGYYNDPLGSSVHSYASFAQNNENQPVHLESYSNMRSYTPRGQQRYGNKGVLDSQSFHYPRSASLTDYRPTESLDGHSFHYSPAMDPSSYPLSQRSALQRRSSLEPQFYSSNH